MSFLFKLTIAILIVFAILFPILISSDNKLSALFWKIPKDFWVFLIIMYGAIITVVFIESSEQARIRRQQYLQQYKMWICPYISRHLLSLNPLQARCRRYSRGER